MTYCGGRLFDLFVWCTAIRPSVITYFCTLTTVSVSLLPVSLPRGAIHSADYVVSRCLSVRLSHAGIIDLLYLVLVLVLELYLSADFKYWYWYLYLYLKYWYLVHTCVLPINTNCSSPARLHRRLLHGRFPHRARCPGMLFPRSFVTQPSPSASSDNP